MSALWSSPLYIITLQQSSSRTSLSQMMNYVLPSYIATAYAQLSVVVLMPPLLQSLALASPLPQTLPSVYC